MGLPPESVREYTPRSTSGPMVLDARYRFNTGGAKAP
jgi:hypothetical protein